MGQERRAGLRLTGWTARLALGAVAIGSTALVLPFGPLAPPGDGSAPTTAPAVAGAPESAPATGISGKLRTDALVPKPGTSRVRLHRPRTEPFSLVGVTWNDARSSVKGTVEVRTRDESGTWSRWQTLETDHGDVPDTRGSNLRGGTAPLWVGESVGVKVRVDGRTGGRLPAGLRIDLIDPGAETTAAPAMEPASFSVPLAAAGRSGSPRAGDLPTGGEQPTPAATPAPTPTDASPSAGAETTPAATPSPAAPTTRAADDPTPTPTASTPAPTATRPPVTTSPVTAPEIVTRAGWQADESIRPGGDPAYAAAAKVVFVHHSATSGDYACTDSARILRGIYTYHVQSQGWDDFGYNFAVDKCGTVFEGRAGGVELPVIGSHTYGFNTNSTGVMVIGNFETVPAPDAVTEAIAHVAAWKLGFSGGDPTGTATLVQAAADSPGFVKGQTYSFRTVSGHRDGRVTECPGEQLYAQLPSIRTLATTAAAPALTKLTGATQAGTTWHTTGTVTATWTGSTPSRLVARHELLVDAKVAATAGAGASSAKLTLAPGSHTLAVRTVHVQGGSATSSPTTVLADATAPIFSKAPKLVLRTGTVTKTAVPVALSWKATDNTALAAVKATAPTKATFTPTTTSWKTTAKPGGKRTFTLSAADLAGNTRTASTSATAKLVKETAAKRTGTWSTKTSSKHLNGSALASTRKNASLSWTFTGSSVTWIATRTTGSGKATVHLDGTKVATIDLKAGKSIYRQGVWTAAGLKSGKHTLKIVVAATKDRPTVTSDGIAVLAP